MGAVIGRLVHIGVDIGQKHDPTAIVVCQVLERLGRALPPTKAFDPRQYRMVEIQNRQLETYYEARHIEKKNAGDQTSGAARGSASDGARTQRLRNQD
jgi:hypothetical protein